MELGILKVVGILIVGELFMAAGVYFTIFLVYQSLVIIIYTCEHCIVEFVKPYKFIQQQYIENHNFVYW